MSLQEALRQMRLELGITQTDLAKQLNKSFLTVNRWENGKGFPSRDNAKNILEIARKKEVSSGCYDYLKETLMPDVKRSKSAAAYGFPDIDRDFLFQLADGSMNSLYVIEAGTYNLLYANRKAEQAAHQYLQERGETGVGGRLSEQVDKRCFHYFSGFSAPCPFCPLKDIKRGEFTDKIVTIPESGRIFNVHAKLEKMKDKEIYAVYLTDLTEKDAETRALYELTNDIPCGVGIYNAYENGRIELVFMNQAFFRMIGDEKREKLLESGDSDLGLIHPEDRKRLRAEIKKTLSEGKELCMDIRMRVFGRKYQLIHLTGKLINKDSEKSTFYCQFKDNQEE